MMARSMYCASNADHWCILRDLRVSAGLKEVCKEVMLEVGDCLL